MCDCVGRNEENREASLDARQVGQQARRRSTLGPADAWTPNNRIFKLKRGRKPMKRFVITVALACIFSGLAHGDEYRRHDGSWWVSSVDRGIKLGYVAGIIDGTIAVCKTVAVDAGRDFCAQNSALITLTPMGGAYVTNGQMVDGLDHFYQDYRNQSVFVTSAMVYVLLELQGTNPQVLEQYRRTLLNTTH
jgi:hypothetical protein